MKKSLALLFLGMLWLLSATAKAQIPDKEKEGLIGPVKTVRTERAVFSAETGQLKEGPRLPLKIVTYDPAGRTTEEMQYDHEGALISRRVHIYNQANLLIEMRDLSGTGALQFKTLYTYDANGRLAKDSFYTAKGALENYLIRKYDSQGRVIEWGVYGADGRLRLKHKKTYDNEGNVATDASYFGDKLAHKDVNTYDANGRMTKRVVYDEKGKVLDTTVWSYDSRGNITELAAYNPDGSLNSKRRTAYEFDTVGNWLKLSRSKLIHKNGKTFYEMEEANYRTITYYGIDAAPVTESASQVNAAKLGDSNEKIDDDRNPQSIASTEEIPQERPPSVPKVIRKSGGVLQQDAIKRARPVYPPLARAAKVSGKVEVELRVDEEGNVISTKIISGHSLLRDAAAEAAKQWKFKPTKLSGVAVQVIGIITFNFELDDSATGNNDIEALENAARNNPNSAEAHYELGAAYYRSNRYDEAIKALKESVRIKPESADAHKKLGLAYGALKLYSEAEAELAAARRINPEDTEAVVASGLVLAALYRYDEAIKAFKESIEREPQMAETYSYLAMTYSAMGRKEDAIAAFKQGLKIYPDDARSHYRLGLLYIESGDKKAAMETYGALKKLDGRLADSLLKEINQ